MMTDQESAALQKIAKDFIPDIDRSDVAIAAPGKGPGFWVGASSAIEHDGAIYLAYRTRQPIELGRGQGVIVAKSVDGVDFTTICTIDKAAMDAESLERPTLIRTPEGTWRLYLSCATTGTKHWRVELLEASDPSGFLPETRKVVLPSDKRWGVKDTVIQWHDDQWNLWATMHPLDIPDAEDRMVSDYATSSDGVSWEWQGTALKPSDDSTWDKRGTRITAVRFTPNGVITFYDGRANAAENYNERTGIAVGASPDHFESVSKNSPVAQSPDGKALRYLDIVPLSSGRYRLYYELSKSDGSHELRTELR